MNAIPWRFVALALVGALLISYGLAPLPSYMDAFYHFNAAVKLAAGEGFVDPYLWVYIGAPDSLPAPSHLYWMPLTSIVAAGGMALFNAPGSYAAAQLPLALLFFGTVCIGYGLGWLLGGTRRHAWVAGLLTLFSGFFVRFWGATDTFAPYAFVGGACLLALGWGVRAPGRLGWFALAGALAGLGHLTRADGLLLLVAGWAALLWPGRGLPIHQRLIAGALLTAAYVAVMTPWFLRNLDVIGSPLATGGTQGIWFTEYNDLFNYPADAGPAQFFADGLGTLLRSRWEGISSGLQTLIAVEGWIVMTPFMLIGLWMKRGDALVRPFWLYALGMHLAMTVIFTYPGIRGGLFHSAAALIPWWAVLGTVGLDAAVDWAARRRRHWQPTLAKRIFSAAAVGFAVLLSLMIALPSRGEGDVPPVYAALRHYLPPDARVLSNDPPQLYYFTGLGGASLPNEPPEALRELAQQYGIDYVLFEGVSADRRMSNFASARLWPALYESYPFLREIDLGIGDVVLYEIVD